MTRHYPDLGSDTSSVWNFCAFFSDVLSRGNQWWRREMSSVFSVLDSGFHTVYSGFQILDSRFLQLSATWIPDPNRIGIPQSLSGIPDSKAQDSEFNKQKLPSFRNPYYLRQGVRYCIGVIGESYFPSCLFPENAGNGTLISETVKLKLLFQCEHLQNRTLRP